MTECPTCGSSLPPDGPEGLCPTCVFQLVTESSVPKSIGEHDILGEIDRGGMGIVYRARDRGIGRIIALKVIRSDALARREARTRFLTEVSFISRFDHPNIVPIYSANIDAEGYPFYTMPWIEGGSLAHHIERFREPKRAARLMATVARAVQFCHDAKPEPVLHRDLKPENILLGPDDHPYLADFGIAKALRQEEVGQAGQTRSGAIVGTLEYMSPEQALSGRVRPASDVYGLGAILYELLTAKPPLGTGSVPEMLERIRYHDPIPPRTVVLGLPRDIEKICLRALAKDPGRRHRSAAELADDLERFLRDEPYVPPEEARWQAALYWAQRHPAAAIGTLGAVLTLAIAAASTVWLVRDQHAELLHRAMQINAFAARAQAGAMLNQLREYAATVEQAATDPALQAALSQPRGQATDQVLEAHASAFDAMTLFSTDGIARLRWPQPPEVLGGRSFAFRDYFAAATQLGYAKSRRAVLAPAYRSAHDGAFQFAFAAPTFDAQGSFDGVLLAMLGTSSTLGKVTIDDTEQSGRITALVGPHETERGTVDSAAAQGNAPSRGPSERFFVLVHPKLEHGQACELPQRDAARLRRAFGMSAAAGQQLLAVRATPIEETDYRDPVTRDRQRWLAAFAPVGRTGYGVLVQSPYKDATPASSTLSAIARRVGLPLGAAMLLLWAVMLRLTRRTAR